MEKKSLIIRSLVVLASSFLLRCSATTYMVGDSSGWDVSSDLASWPMGKTFQVGDALVFQYSSSHSLNEVTQKNFNACNTSNVLKAYTNGNTTVTLSNPGDRLFVCGNRLHCLGGMKLRVTVEGDPATAPATAPGAAPDSRSGTANPPATRQQPSLKNNNDDIIPSSSGLVLLMSDVTVYFFAFFSFVYLVL